MLLHRISLLHTENWPKYSILMSARDLMLRNYLRQSMKHTRSFGIQRNGRNMMPRWFLHRRYPMGGITGKDTITGIPVPGIIPIIVRVLHINSRFMKIPDTRSHRVQSPGSYRYCSSTSPFSWQLSSSPSSFCFPGSME